jgi:hypothetical protein
VNAGDAGHREHAREAFLRRGRIQGRAIEKKLVSGHCQQHAGFVVRAEGDAQFSPRGVVLLHCARMAEVVHPRELEQNVQAAHERASCCLACIVVGHVPRGVIPPC